MDILFIGFVKFKTKQDQFCICFILAQLPTGTAQIIFSEPFSEKRKRPLLTFSCFSYLFNALTRLFLLFLCPVT